MAFPTIKEILDPIDKDTEEEELKILVLSRLTVKLNVGNFSSLPAEIQKSLKTSVEALCSQYISRYKSAGSYERFLRKQKKWLISPIWLDLAANYYFNNLSAESDSDSDSDGCDMMQDCLDGDGPDINDDDDSDYELPITKEVKSEPKCSPKKRKYKKKQTDIKTKKILKSEKSPMKSKKEKTKKVLKSEKSPLKKKKETDIKTKKVLESEKSPLKSNTESTSGEMDLDDYEIGEILFAAAKAAKLEGKLGLAKRLKQLEEGMNTKDFIEASNSDDKIYEPVTPVIPFTSEEAVVLCVENNIAVRQYRDLKLTAKVRNAEIYPAYNFVNKGKQACYPSGIQVNMNVTEVPLQSLLNHTTERIINLQKESILGMIPHGADGRLKMILSVKWGYDGSSASMEWKQQLPSESEDDLFCVSLVPLSLKCTDDDIWQNPIPTSARMCRPISLQNGRDTPALIHEVQMRTENQIRELKPYSTTLKIKPPKKKKIHWKTKQKIETPHLVKEEKTSNEECKEMEKETKKADEKETEAITTRELVIDVYYHVQQTLTDPGMVANGMLISDVNSSQNCHLCCSKPNPFDQHQLNTTATQSIINPESFKHSLSPLHAWVSCFECLIHLSCYLGEKDYWNDGSDLFSVRYSQRKAQIQQQFYDEMGLIIDKPRNGTVVTTNDAKVAKAAFRAEEEFARICGLDQSLIHRFNVILLAISCEFEVNAREFDLYCQTTAELFNALYHWFQVPLVVHKILHHGAVMVSELILPIGMMSEEAQKARHFSYKSFFSRHTKIESQHAKKEGMIEALKYLMVTTDPTMSTNSLDLRKSRQNWKELGDVISLLKNSDILSDIPNEEEVRNDHEITFDDPYTMSDTPLHRQEVTNSSSISYTENTQAMVSESATQIHSHSHNYNHPNILKINLDSFLRM